MPFQVLTGKPDIPLSKGQGKMFIGEKVEPTFSEEALEFDC